QEWFVARDEIVRAHSPRGVTRVDAVDETKRWPMWKQRDEIAAIVTLVRHAARTLPALPPALLRVTREYAAPDDETKPRVHPSCMDRSQSGVTLRPVRESNVFDPLSVSPLSSPGGLLVRVAVVFPGQGTQSPAMGAPWREHPAWKIVEQAEAALGES